MTWIAKRFDDMKDLREGASATRDVHRYLQVLHKSDADPAAPEVQALIAQENEVAVRYGTHNVTAELFEWNAPVAEKWLQLSERALSRVKTSGTGAPDEGLMNFLRAARAASPWTRALEPIVQEATALVDRREQASSTSAQALAGRLRAICAEHLLGDPLLYARWARAMQCRTPTDDLPRRQAAWSFLSEAVKAAPSAA